MNSAKKKYEAPKFEVVKFDTQIATARWLSKCYGDVTYNVEGYEFWKCTFDQEEGDPVVFADEKDFILN